MSVSVRRLTDPHDPALSAFGRVQQQSYYAPETLIPPEYFAQFISLPHNRLLVAQDAQGTVLGGTLYSLLSAAGFNSFMGVSRQAQGQGVGRALQRASLQDLRAAGLGGMFADSVHFSRQSEAEKVAEQAAGSSALTRRKVLGALGFLTVDLPYWQPVGGEDGGPLKDLDLMYCPLEPVSSVSLAEVTATLQDYWRGWLGAERAAQEAQALAQRTVQTQVPLLSSEATPQYWQR